MIEAQSTPTTTRVKELSLDDLYNFMRTMNSNINVKFDVQNSEINEIKSNVNEKFDEIRDEIKQQNINFSKQVKEINTRCDSITEQILESISNK